MVPPHASRSSRDGEAAAWVGDAAAAASLSSFASVRPRGVRARRRGTRIPRVLPAVAHVEPVERVTEIGQRRVELRERLLEHPCRLRAISRDLRVEDSVGHRDPDGQLAQVRRAQVDQELASALAHGHVHAGAELVGELVGGREPAGPVGDPARGRGVDGSRRGLAPAPTAGAGAAGVAGAAGAVAGSRDAAAGGASCPDPACGATAVVVVGCRRGPPQRRG